MKNEYGQWRKLDNAALAFPAVTGKNDTRVFRFYCELKEEIKEEKCITLAFVGDERICDGFYYANSFKSLFRYLKKPELLETAPDYKQDVE